MALTHRLRSGGRSDMAAGVVGNMIAATENWRTAVAILKLAFSFPRGQVEDASPLYQRARKNRIISRPALTTSDRNKNIRSLRVVTAVLRFSMNGSRHCTAQFDDDVREPGQVRSGFGAAPQPIATYGDCSLHCCPGARGKPDVHHASCNE